MRRTKLVGTKPHFVVVVVRPGGVDKFLVEAFAPPVGLATLTSLQGAAAGGCGKWWAAARSPDKENTRKTQEKHKRLRCCSGT